MMLCRITVLLIPVLIAAGEIDEVLREFSSLTNAEAYVHAFANRVVEPIPNRPLEFFGNDQRILMVPFIEKLVADLPQNGEVFDVGAGTGDMMDHLLKDAPEGTVINVEEPNQTLIETYLRRLENHANLQSGHIYKGYLQDYYRKEQPVSPPQQPQNLILAIHMIYPLTDFRAPSIDPEEDLIQAVSFLYDLLASDGSIFLVYADLAPHHENFCHLDCAKNSQIDESKCGCINAIQPHLDSSISEDFRASPNGKNFRGGVPAEGPNGGALTNLAEKYFHFTYPDERYADNLVAIYQARNTLFGPGGSIAKELAKRFPETNPQLLSERCSSHFFGRSVTDIAAAALISELCPSNEAPFELQKLQFCLDFVSQHPDYIGLQKEERDIPQKGYWRANQPQVVAIITKRS